jgi:hypothetical protein
VLEGVLRKTLGPGFLPLFAVSAQSRMELLKTPSSVAGESDFLGASISQVVLSAIPTLKPVKPMLAVRSARVPVALAGNQIERVLAAREKLPRIGKGALTPSEETDICRILEQHQRGTNEALLEVQVVKLGVNTVLVGLPGEMPVDLAGALRRGSPFKNTLLIGHCQETFADSSSAKSCEVVLPKPVAELLIQSAADLLNQLK